MGKIKLAFFDMEGTIFRNRRGYDDKRNVAPSVWTTLAEALGSAALVEEDKTKDLWHDGSYMNYIEWQIGTIKVYEKYGLTKDKFEEVLFSNDYYPGVKEVFEELRKKGIATVLITGGFKAQADKAQLKLKIDHVFAGCELFWNEKGLIEHWNLMPSDYEGKIDFMNLMIKEYKVAPEECLFVGDGKNDIPLAKVVGTSICFNGAKELQAVATYAINQPVGKEDFKAVLKFVK